MDALEFVIDGARYAVPLHRVVDVLRRVWLTPLPDGPAHVRGIFGYRGAVAIAVDVRERLGHAVKPPHVEDLFVMTSGAIGPIAVIVEEALGVRSIDSASLREAPLARNELAGVVALPDGLLLIDNLDRLLSITEESSIQERARELAP